MSKLGECEFWLISELNAQLIVHHPYRDLTNLRGTLSLTADEFQLCWSMVNDHYISMLPLLHPPVIVAAAVITMVLVVPPNQTGFQARKSAASRARNLGQKPEGQQVPEKDQRLVSWLAESELDVEAVAACTQEFVSLYAVLERYSERTCREQIGKLVKG